MTNTRDTAYREPEEYRNRLLDFVKDKVLHLTYELKKDEKDEYIRKWRN